MYCVYCGVKLQDGAKECPLCRTPVLIAGGPETAEKALYPDRLPEKESRHGAVLAVSLLTTVMIAACLGCLVFCLRTYGEAAVYLREARGKVVPALCVSGDGHRGDPDAAGRGDLQVYPPGPAAPAGAVSGADRRELHADRVLPAYHVRDANVGLVAVLRVRLRCAGTVPVHRDADPAAARPPEEDLFLLTRHLKEA